MPIRKMSLRAGWIVSMVATVLCLLGCQSQTDSLLEVEYSQNVSSGEVELTVSAPVKELRSSEMLTVDLTVHYPPHYKIQLPEVTDKWGNMIVFETRDEPAHMGTDQKIRVSRQYTLEPDEIGDCVLESITILATTPQGDTISLETEPIEVTVLSVLASGDDEIRNIASGDPIQSGSKLNWWMIFLMSATVVSFIFVNSKFRKTEPVQKSTSLDDFRALSGLPPVDLMSQIEPTVVSVLSEGKQLNLSAKDFSGLVPALTASDIDTKSLTAAIERYEKLQYGSQLVSEETTAAMYAEFDRVIIELTDSGKESV